MFPNFQSVNFGESSTIIWGLWNINHTSSQCLQLSKKVICLIPFFVTPIRFFITLLLILLLEKESICTPSSLSQRTQTKSRSYHLYPISRFTCKETCHTHNCHTFPEKVSFLSTLHTPCFSFCKTLYQCINQCQ